MSSDASRPAAPPSWLLEALGINTVAEGRTVTIGASEYILERGILRERGVSSPDQEQTSKAFGFKWHQRDTFESEQSLRRTRDWLTERYGDVSSAPWWNDYQTDALVMDAGCGAAMSALELLAGVLPRVRYLGVDISSAIDVAATRFAERGLCAGFIQADITRVPLAPGSVDVILSEGVLHHTDSTREALLALAALLRPGGRFLFYVYRRKGPIREFTDDHIRSELQEMSAAHAWEALKPVTRLGQALGQLELELEVPEKIELLSIPAGQIDIQRFFYWHVLKAFYRPDASFDELHHINYDWFAPANAHRQSPEDVRAWCDQAGLEIEREDIQNSGITVIARRRSS